VTDPQRGEDADNKVNKAVNQNVKKDGEDEGNRTVENMVLAGFFIALVAAGVWLLSTMADVRKVQDCAAQGRRNCQTIEVPERSR
jgi:hypothetical protein